MPAVVKPTEAQKHAAQRAYDAERAYLYAQQRGEASEQQWGDLLVALSHFYEACQWRAQVVDAARVTVKF